MKQKGSGLLHVLIIVTISAFWGTLAAFAAGFPMNGWRYWVFAYCLTVLMGIGLALLFPANGEDD